MNISADAARLLVQQDAAFAEQLLLRPNVHVKGKGVMNVRALPALPITLHHLWLRGHDRDIQTHALRLLHSCPSCPPSGDAAAR